MPISRNRLAQEFAQRISKAFKSPKFRKLLESSPGHEQKAVGEETKSYLNGFMKAEAGDAPCPKPQFGWEGDGQRRLKEKRYYPVLGVPSFPDAAVLAPFKCAFEFDRELDEPSEHRSRFKAAMMKAAVHVLSGAYEACVFVYVLQPGSSPRSYFDNNRSTKRLVETLQDAGLYVTFIRSR